MAFQSITATFAVEATALDAGDVANNAVISFPVSTSSKGGYSKGKIISLLIIDNDHNTAANLVGNLFLFSSSVTPAAADAAHSISDGDAAKFIGFIPIAAADCALSALNTVACVRLSAPLGFDIGTGLGLFGIYVVTATPTFGGAVLTMVLGVETSKN